MNNKIEAYTFVETNNYNFMTTRIFLLIIILSASISSAFCQEKKEKTNGKKHFIGSTLFVLATPILSPSPEYLQLNYGYRITTNDVISVEAITWAYHAPVGIPYGSVKDSQNYNFPGKVKGYGIGFAYKRFIWKKAYTAIHSTALHQNYLDLNNQIIKSGFQLFNTLRFGYQFQFFNNRLFLEPSLAFTYWPINTNLPSSFQIEEDKWPNYFLFEPGLHFGINF